MLTVDLHSELAGEISDVTVTVTVTVIGDIKGAIVDIKGFEVAADTNVSDVPDILMMTGVGEVSS